MPLDPIAKTHHDAPGALEAHEEPRSAREVERLMEKHARWVERTARYYVRTKPRGLDLTWEDIVSDVAVKLCRFLQIPANANAIESSSERAFLSQIVRNAFFDRLRVWKSQGGPARHELDASDLYIPSHVELPNQERRLIQRQQLRELLKQYPRRLRAVVLLNAQGYSTKEISARLGLPEGTVSSRMHDARELGVAPLRPRKCAE